MTELSITKDPGRPTSQRSHECHLLPCVCPDLACQLRDVPVVRIAGEKGNVGLELGQAPAIKDDATFARAFGVGSFEHFKRLLPVVPPLAYWLAEIALRLAGFFGVYVLSQICIVVALWAVFTLGRATLGERHAALGTLLMTGIYFITVPTPEFSPAILAMPLWALALLHFWRTVAEGRELYWLALAADLVLLLLTTYLATFQRRETVWALETFGAPNAA